MTSTLHFKRTHVQKIQLISLLVYFGTTFSKDKKMHLLVGTPINVDLFIHLALLLLSIGKLNYLKGD
jgi:hypothetical protein